MPEQSTTKRAMFSRRHFLKTSGSAAVGVGGLILSKAALAADTLDLPFKNGERSLVRFPQKRPLILLTTRPPQLETPFSVFNEGVFTPNDAFFVRYHLAQVPTSINPDTFRVAIKGKVNSALELSLEDIKTKFEPVEIAAVNQCSGNGRGFSTPRVAGGQLGNGAMGNAKWKGVRLKDVLTKAGLAATAKQVTFNGLDTPPVEKVPDFIKALDIDQAIDDDTLLAYEMNGEPLPMLNGYPLRLILPGYYGTYWVKHVNEITVLDEPFSGFWMDPAYRIPDNSCACVEPGTPAKKTKPIARYNVRSFITSHSDGAKVQQNKSVSLRGIAFDGGYGITEVLLSEDGGQTWRATQLGKDYGKYSFREWTASFTPRKSGELQLKVKATNRIGQSQPLEALWNPAGYMRNLVETTRLIAS
ncbi:MAG TPA: molybdopterin-dependent oxidoreductase [Candidatus Dormibacteraeota bacterium]|nr:molybdopterin-dependent oxidoreductase [Candidatus Dormibacteraeota bacterium]